MATRQMLCDWRELDASRLSAAWAEQSARWSGTLFWDAERNWSQIEAARRDGRLPGLALIESGSIEAWCYFLVHQDTLQIGGFESASDDATGLLLDATLSAVDRSQMTSGAMLFTFSGAAGLLPALAARDFETDPYLYLVREVADVSPQRSSLAWEPQVAVHLPALLAEAYRTQSLTRPFARHGRMEEWREYAAQLIGSTACGAFDPALSSASFSADGTLEGVVLTTVVGHGTAHIAQVVVHPRRQGSGLGGALLGATIDRVRAAGFARVSLLVSEGNAPARRLYRRLGFREVTSFVSAGRAALDRVAVSMGTRQALASAPSDF